MPRSAYISLLLLLAGLSFFPLAMPSSFSINDASAGPVAGVPIRLGVWHGVDTELDERTYEILETRNVLSRTYTDDEGHRLHLLIVGSERDRRVAHPPEVCYTASHYTISNATDDELEVGTRTIPIKRFLAQDTRDVHHREEVMYVYKVGDTYATNYYAQQLIFSWKLMRQQASQILLIRLSGPDRTRFPEFLNNVLPHLS